MIHDLELRVDPRTAAEPDALRQAALASLGISDGDVRKVEVVRRSIDARGRQVRVQLRLRVYEGEDPVDDLPRLPDYPRVDDAPEVLVVGAGPAGLFAALRLVELGLRPVILERGKDVRARVKDLKAINTRHLVNPDSNYCFGEGGAGTYSDGKLYTRAKKRGDVRRILELLVGFGADPGILVEAHPHIGTNRLPRLIATLREHLLAHGAEIRFETRVTDLVFEGEGGGPGGAGAGSGSRDRLVGVRTAGGETIRAAATILATGHSARDIFRLLHGRGVEIDLKPLAVGVRVEHPQPLIDQIQYSCGTDRGPWLPPSAYALTRQVEGRGVYSFCMCPGGVICPSATEPGQVVTNGWSASTRARPTANSGIVVELVPEDFRPFASHGPLAAMAFQEAIEVRAWELGGRSQVAPAQRLDDFVHGRVSGHLPRTSYPPGITSVELGEVLPDFVTAALRQGFRLFDRSMRGYLTNEAVVHAPETRTSSPVRVPRDATSLEHPRVAGLFPCGEGAGYAGGIVSAAMDGERVAEAVGRRVRA
jgi:uncharacterized protein